MAFVVGQKVEAKWNNGQWYPATVSTVNPNGTYAIAYDDGSSEANQNATDIRSTSPSTTSCLSFRWEIKGNHAVSISARANKVWMTNSFGEILEWKSGNWVERPGSDLIQVSVGEDGSVWCLSKTKEVFQWNGGGWTKNQPGWHCGGVGAVISVHNSKNVWGCSGGGVVEIWHWDGSSWSVVPQTQNPRHVSVGTDGTVWYISGYGGIYCASPEAAPKGNWQRLPHPPTPMTSPIATMSLFNASVAYGISEDKQLFSWNGRFWDKVEGYRKCSAVSCASDQEVWCITEKREIYHGRSPTACESTQTTNQVDATQQAEKLKTLTESFFSTWNFDESKYLDRVIGVVSDSSSMAGELLFLKEDVVQRFVRDMEAYHTQAVDLTSSGTVEATASMTPTVNPDEVKAKLREIAEAFFSTWKLDEEEFLGKTLDAILSPDYTILDIHFLKEDIVPRKQKEFMQALELFHQQVVEVVAPLFATQATKEESLDPIFEERPTKFVNPEALADTGIPFFLMGNDPYSSFACLMPAYLKHGKYKTDHMTQLCLTWEQLSAFPENYRLGRWLLHRVSDSPDRFTMTPYIYADNNVDWRGFTFENHESKIDIQFRINAEEDEWHTIDFVKEQRRLMVDTNTVTGLKPDHYLRTGQAEKKRGHWRFFPAPCTRKHKIPDIACFARTQIPFQILDGLTGLVINNNIPFGGQIGSTTDYKEKKSFRLVKCMWEGINGYRLIDASEDTNYSGFAFGWSEPMMEGVNSHNGMLCAEEQKPGKFDSRSFITLHPSCQTGFVHILFPETNAILTTDNMVSDKKGPLLQVKGVDYVGVGFAGVSNFTFVPYSQNPSDWPADPNLSEINLSIQWGETGESFAGNYCNRYIIAAEATPARSGTRLVLTHTTASRPGCNWIIEPCADKPGSIRILSADNPTLCMCVESNEENAFVTLTNKRGDNTLIKCEFNKDVLRHWGNHYYKFECSDLYFNVRRPSDSRGSKHFMEGCHIVQNCVVPDTFASAFRLIMGGLNVNLTKRPRAQFYSIYDELYPADACYCVCGEVFDTNEELEGHKQICNRYLPVPRTCYGCCGTVLVYSFWSGVAHAKVCVKDNRGNTPRPNECPTCVITFPDAKSLQEHVCKGEPWTPSVPDEPRWAYIYGATEEEMKKHLAFLQPSAWGSGSTAAAPVKQQDPAEVEENKKRLRVARTGCTPSCGSDILVCKDCKKFSGCLFCSSPKNNERVKACGNCREKQGGGWGKVTSKPNHISAGCRHCGSNKATMGFYNVCASCKRTYGGGCYYKYLE